MDVDSDASAESVPESEEVSSNHESDDSDDSTSELNGEVIEDVEDVDGPIDVQMISRVLNEAEV